MQLCTVKSMPHVCMPSIIRPHVSVFGWNKERIPCDSRKCWARFSRMISKRNFCHHLLIVLPNHSALQISFHCFSTITFVADIYHDMFADVTSMPVLTCELWWRMSDIIRVRPPEFHQHAVYGDVYCGPMALSRIPVPHLYTRQRRHLHLDRSSSPYSWLSMAAFRREDAWSFELMPSSNGVHSQSSAD